MRLTDRILSVDDNRDNLLIIEELLESTYMVMSVDSGEKALAVAPHFRPHLILLDVMMPGLDGYQTCRLLRAQPEMRNTKIVMLSAKAHIDDRLAAYALGVADYITKPFDEREVLAKVRAWMQMTYKQQVEDIWQEVERTREAVGAALVSLATLQDIETGEHLLRMRWYADALAERLGAEGLYRDYINESFLRQLYQACPLHDLGKVAIPAAVLHKPCALEGFEYEILKRHTTIGGDILTEAATKLPDADYLKMAALIARHHHERFDGSGYPDKLSGQAIPLAARIVTVADAFDALTSERVSKDKLSATDAATAIEAGAGSQFDPVIVEALRSRLAHFEDAQSRLSEGYSMSFADHRGAILPAHPALPSVDHLD